VEFCGDAAKVVEADPVVHAQLRLMALYEAQRLRETQGLAPTDDPAELRLDFDTTEVTITIEDDGWHAEVPWQTGEDKTVVVCRVDHLQHFTHSR
jgi:hypothetical protein